MPIHNNRLLNKIDEMSPYRAKFIQLMELVDLIMSQQIPEGIQVVVTEEDYYTDHGLNHIDTVLTKLAELDEFVQDLNEAESFFLLFSAYCHDLGMFMGGNDDESYEDRRKNHHLRSVDVVQAWNAENRIRLNNMELTIISAIIRAHSRNTDINSIPNEHRCPALVRTRLLGALLRIADAAHCDATRAPRAIYELFFEAIPESSRTYWKNHFPITAVYFDRKKAGIVISSELTGTTPQETIEKYRATNYTRMELTKELDSVQEVFSLNNVRLNRVWIKDFLNDELVELSYLTTAILEQNHIIIGLKSNLELDIFLQEIPAFLTEGNSVPIILLISPPEGPLIISTGLFGDPDDINQIDFCLRDTMGQDFQYIQFSEINKERTIISE